MARKKRVNRGVKRRVSKSRKLSKKVSRKSANLKNYRNFVKNNLRKKIALVVNNLLLFIALSLVSFVLYRFLQNDLLVNLFFVMATVFGFVAVAFLISLLVLAVMKFISKRR
jgi:hypothetical protein